MRRTLLGAAVLVIVSVKIAHTPTLYAMKQTAILNSALVVALEQSQVALSSIHNGVRFDIDGDGNREQISWPLDTKTAFLAIDRNHNGRIDSIHELFGNSTGRVEGKTFSSGFSVLASYDDNDDDKIDGRDAIFEELLIWRDKNRNGVTDFNELSTLESHAIFAIELLHQVLTEADVYGNKMQRAVVYAGALGTVEEWTVADVWFASSRESPGGAF